jgi:hypothetical protein
MNFRLFAEDRRRLPLGAEKMGVPAAIYLQFALREMESSEHHLTSDPSTDPDRPTPRSPVAIRPRRVLDHMGGAMERRRV